MAFLLLNLVADKHWKYHWKGTQSFVKNRQTFPWNLRDLFFRIILTMQNGIETCCDAELSSFWWKQPLYWVHWWAGEHQSLSCAWLIETPQTAARKAFLPFTISWRLLKLMSIESVMPSNHLILCHLHLLPSIFPSIRVFSNELVA